MITNEVRVRLTQLQDASEDLVTAAENIEEAVQTTNGIVESLIARGFVSPAATAFHTRFLNETTWMDEWPLQVRHFSNLLDAAHDALKDAAESGDGGGMGTDDPLDPSTDDQDDGSSMPDVDTSDPVDSSNGSTGNSPGGNGSFPPPPSVPMPGGNSGTGTGGNIPSSEDTLPDGTSSSSSSSRRSGSSNGSSYSRNNQSSSESSSDDEEPEAPPEAAPLEAYMSQANRELYDQMEGTQAQITTEEENITLLQARRQAVQENLDDLTQRLEQVGASTENARVQALRDEIARIDGDIAASQGRIGELNTEISDIQTRLERVRPAPGADLDLIASLEGSRTIDAILNATLQSDNSINCVNWISNRMPIPPGIPGNAMDWIDNAAANPEYGISVGDVPLVGSVIVMQPEHSYANDQYGHVMYIERIENGQIWITDNTNHTPVLLSSLTDEIGGPYMKFMYFPWQTQA